MTLSDANLLKIRNVYQRDYLDLPLAKDLPRLAKFISICDEDGVRLSYLESKRLDIEHYIKEKGPEFGIFYQVRRVLLTLCLALEGPEKCLEADRALLKLVEEQDFLLPEVVNPFLAKHFGGDTGKVVRVLKCVNQAAIAPSLIEMKMAMGVENTTKDVAGSWRIFIVLSSDSLTVTHIKKEVCIQNRFLLEWNLKFTLSFNQMDQLRGIKFEILDLSFNNEASVKKVNEVKTLVKPYLHPKLNNQITLSKPQLMVQEIPAEERKECRELLQPWPGEVFYLKLENVDYIHSLPSQPVTNGTIFLGNYAISFQSSEISFAFALTNIGKMVSKSKNIEFQCKDCRSVRFQFSTKDDLKTLMEYLGNIIPTTERQAFADAYCKGIIRQLTAVEASSFALLSNGWRCYNIEQEFERMGMNITEWSISDLNIRFQLCETYPGLIVVPRSVSDAEILMSCRYRKGGRVPVLSWVHRNTSILCHSAAPLNDVKSSLSKEDDKVVAAIIQTTLANENLKGNSFSFNGKRFSSQSSEKNIKMDGKLKILKRTRNRSELKKGKTQSKDIAPPSPNKNDCRFYIFDIYFKNNVPSQPRDLSPFTDLLIPVGSEVVLVDTLSELKESYKKLQKLCSSNNNLSEDQRWLQALDNSKWLSQLKTIMEATYRIVEVMEFGNSVYLCCPEDNWDRTCQISSLAQLWMDPYYRTIKGFAVLIEKEWLSFGHPFAERSSLFNDSNEVIPVFIQWLDTVYQTLQQFPNYFEFNNTLLVELAEHTFSGVYGTFMFDNEQSRRTNLARMNTESFWTHVQDNFLYRNPFYNSSPDITLVASYNPRVITLWTSFYLRWYEGSTTITSLPREGFSPTGKDVIASTNTRELSEKQQLERHILSLQTMLDNVRQQIDAKEEVLELVSKGKKLNSAIKQVVKLSRNHSGIDVNGIESPSCPVLLRRKSSVSKIVCSHTATLARSSSQFNFVQRRSSVPDSGMNVGDICNENEPKRGRGSRKIRSVYMQADDVKKALSNFSKEESGNDQ